MSVSDEKKAMDIEQYSKADEAQDSEFSEIGSADSQAEARYVRSTND